MLLKKGNYMTIKEVVDYVERKTGRKANIKLPTHYHNYLGYYDTNDLKAIMPVRMFREMECVVSTLMVTK
jgi:hypothetical protein